MIEERKRDYAGFNLLVGELGATGQFKMGYTSNRSEDHGRIVTEESVGLSNSTLEEPWPKVVEGNTALAEAYMQCREGAVDEDAEKDALVGRLWNVLSCVSVLHRCEFCGSQLMHNSARLSQNILDTASARSDAAAAYNSR